MLKSYALIASSFSIKRQLLKMFEELSNGIGQILTHSVITATVINSETPQTSSCELWSCHEKKILHPRNNFV